jgi:hypothetical protein
VNQPAAINWDSVIAKSDNFVESEVDGEAVLMNLDEGDFSSLKSTGLQIWQMLDEPKPVSQICAGLLDQFDVEEEVCREQTLGFLAALHDKGFITVDA